MYIFFNDTATTEIYTLSLHDALPISGGRCRPGGPQRTGERDVPRRPSGLVGDGHRVRHPGDLRAGRARDRSEEHTSELQSRQYLVCRLLLEKKNNITRLTCTLPPDIT